MINFIRGLFLKVVRAIKDLMLTVFDAATQMLIAEFSDFAADSIRRMAETDLSNDDKRKTVFNDIKAEAGRRVITIKDRQIELIFSIVFNALKNRGIIK